MNISIFGRFRAALALPRGSRGDDLSLVLLLIFSTGMIAGYFMHSCGLMQSFELLRFGADVRGSACFLALTVIAGLLLLFAFSTSYLGLILIPAFMLTGGVLVSTTLASFYADFAYRGLLISAYTIALPMCAALPGFTLAARDCLCASRALLELRFTGVCTCREQLSAYRRLAPAILIVLVSAYYYFILPVICARLF